MIAKKELKLGYYYIGDHRISQIAQWDGTKFLYIRFKFGDNFVDTAKHPEDDDGFALFVPLREIDLTLTKKELEELSLLNY